jgi:hypothetical protein
MKWKMHDESSVRNMVVVSDLHVGALFGPCPSEYDPGGEGESYRNWVRKQWHEFVTKFVPLATNNKPYVLVLNGDMIHGDWSAFGPLAISSSTKQVRAARDLLRPLASKAASVYISEGTSVHTRDVEIDLGEELSSSAKVVKDGKCHSHKSISINMNGLHHRVRHHTSCAGRPWTEASNQGNHLCNDILLTLRNGRTPTDVLILGHRHTHGYTVTADGMSVVTPAWSWVDRHARKVTREDGGIIGAYVLSYTNRTKGEMADVRTFVKQIP